MIKTKIEIKGIPALLWGEESHKICIAVHGSMASKEDDVIAYYAEEAVKNGYRVLSFDLPEHGERKGEGIPNTVQNGVKDLKTVYEHACSIGKPVGLFGCSLGAYYGLLAYKEYTFEQCVFLSPMVNMERMIENMMMWFNVSQERLQAEKEIATPIGETLSWDYYTYVKENPVNQWQSATAILYGSADQVCERETIDQFVDRYNSQLTVLEGGEHYFHTPEQMAFYKKWLTDIFTSQV